MATLLLLVALGLQTSSTRVSGVVTDATALPLPGATVELDGRVVAFSDERGVFEILVPSGRPLRLRVSRSMDSNPTNHNSRTTRPASRSRWSFAESKIAFA